MLLVLEDLHWADQSTRDLLSLPAGPAARPSGCSSSAPTGPTTCTGGTRCARCSPSWSGCPRVERVELSPRSPPASCATTCARCSGEPVPEPLVRGRAGPLRGQRLLRRGAARGRTRPRRRGHAGRCRPALADVLLARLERLPAAVQQIARVASVAGRRVSHPLLQARHRAARRPRSRRRCGRRSTHHVLVADGGDRYAFRHALLQEAVYGDLLPGRAGPAARDVRAAAGGRQSRAPARPSWPTTAWQSHDLPGALSASIRAAAEAAELHAPAEALRNLEQALQLWHAVPDAAERAGCDLISVGLRAAAAAASAGELHRAVALAAAARDLADREAPGSRQAAETRHKLALHLLGADRPEEAYEATAQALEMLPEQPPTPTRVWAAATRGRTAVNLDLDEEGRRWAEEALAGRPAARPRRRGGGRAGHPGPDRGERGRRGEGASSARRGAGPGRRGRRPRGRAAGDVQPGRQPLLRRRADRRAAGAGRRGGPGHDHPASPSARTGWSCGSSR